jgi:HEAT repeat protein
MVPRLLELLASPDPSIRDGAIGTLAELRDPRAVKPLTELARFGDHDMMRRIIDAIAAIGGEEARAYLQFVADGHDHPVIRDLARQALERLDRRGLGGP